MSATHIKHVGGSFLSMIPIIGPLIDGLIGGHGMDQADNGAGLIPGLDQIPFIGPLLGSFGLGMKGKRNAGSKSTKKGGAYTGETLYETPYEAGAHFGGELVARPKRTRKVIYGGNEGNYGDGLFLPGGGRGMTLPGAGMKPKRSRKAKGLFLPGGGMTLPGAGLTLPGAGMTLPGGGLFLPGSGMTRRAKRGGNYGTGPANFGPLDQPGGNTLGRRGGDLGSVGAVLGGNGYGDGIGPELGSINGLGGNGVRRRSKKNN